jgi:murein DD-endopeptidase MepM/ murein hydrolase activator NlpD
LPIYVYFGFIFGKWRMPADRARRKKKTSEFDFVVIPVGQGGTSRSFRLTRPRLWILAVGVFLAMAGICLAGLIFTPLALVVPIPNSVLEERYGRQLLETQRDLRALAEEVLRVSEYNRQLRKALGHEIPDTGLRYLDTAVTTALASEPDAGIDPGSYRDDFDAFDTEPPSTDAGYGERLVRLEFPLVRPVAGVISRGFLPDRMHFGVDYAGKTGTPVFAAGDGYVMFSGWTHDDGNMMVISHGAGYLTAYKHNQSLLRPAHTSVKRGELIALLGSSGETSTGPHLHFEIWKDGVPVDPEAYLLGPPAASLVQQ